MDELLDELRKLGATVSDVDDILHYITVNNHRVTVYIKKEGNKTRYEVGIGGKKCANARNAAYYIITEWLPQRNRIDAMRNLLEVMREDLPEGAEVWMMSDGELRIKSKDADNLRTVIEHLWNKIQATK